jgi:quercetin dioxygenase-like cupin family protein
LSFGGGFRFLKFLWWTNVAISLPSGELDSRQLFGTLRAPCEIEVLAKVANESRYSRSSTNKAVIDRLYLTSLFAAVSVVGVAWLDTALKALAKDVGEDVKPAITTKLPNAPGKSFSAVLVSYPPDGKSRPQHRAGSVFAYVVSGKIRSKNSATGPTRAHVAGERFFEPPGGEHLVSENASAREPASVLAPSLRTSALS